MRLLFCSLITAMLFGCGESVTQAGKRGNSDSLDTAKVVSRSQIVGLTEKLPEILVDKSDFIPCVADDQRIPLPHVQNEAGALRIGRHIFTLTNIGRHENVLGEFDVYSFSVSQGKSKVTYVDSVYAAWLPAFSRDSSWCTISVTTSPREHYSPQNLCLIDINKAECHLLETDLSANTHAPIVQYQGRDYVIYVCDDTLCVYDILSKRKADVASMTYSNIDEEDIYIHKLSDLVVLDGKLTGEIVFHEGNDYRSGYSRMKFSTSFDSRRLRKDENE